MSNQFDDGQHNYCFFRIADKRAELSTCYAIRNYMLECYIIACALSDVLKLTMKSTRNLNYLNLAF